MNLALLTGNATFIVGVEDQPNGDTRVYVGARYKKIYFDTNGEEADKIKRAWAAGGHVIVDTREIPPLKQE